MTERTGLGLVELLTLEALDEIDARPHRPHRKSANVLEHLRVTRGVGPTYGYPALCSLAADWLQNIPLVDPHGNFGTPDFEPAAPRYTEARLSFAGALVLASERGELPRLPIRLINGDLTSGGTAPPFAPAAVVRAVGLAAADSSVSDEELVSALGPPWFPTDCVVTGDLAALAAGERTDLRLSARLGVERRGDSDRISITQLPFGIGPSAIGDALAARVNSARGLGGADQLELRERADLPLRNITDLSNDSLEHLVCDVRVGADAELCRDRILETWPVTITIGARLAAPAAALVRAAADDAEAQAALFEALLAGEANSAP